MDMCQSSPCANGGSCVSNFGSFTCLCPTGYVGDRCETNKNDCSALSCLNGGTCLDEVDNFKCVCRAGFFGTLCQFNVDDCVKRPCANGGTCFDLVNDYKCECRPGFRGKDCSVDVNECESNPCRYGATCEDLVNDYVCYCLPCFFGKDCRQRNDTCLQQHKSLMSVHPPRPLPVGGAIEPELVGRIRRPQVNTNLNNPVHHRELYQADLYGGHVSQDHKQAMVINANLPLVIGIPLVVIFVIIMLALIVIIFCLLRKYKNALPAVCGGDTNDMEAHRDNLRNMHIASMAAKQSKNRSKNDNIIYNNSSSNVPNCPVTKKSSSSKDNRLSVIAAYDSKKAAIEQPYQYFEQRAKNLNIVSSFALDDPTADSKVYKIVSMEKIQPVLKCNSAQESNTSYDTIKENRAHSKNCSGTFSQSNSDKTSLTSLNEGSSDKDYATTSLADHQISVDSPLVTSSSFLKRINDDHGTVMTIGQMDPMRTENLRVAPQFAYSSINPLHRHHEHYKSATTFAKDSHGV